MTNERIDHAAEAREALRGAGDGRNSATDASNAAIAHAVLALVEQQRIQNLIAIMAIEVAEDKPVAQSEATLALYRDGKILPETAAALGLEGAQS